MSHVFVSYSTKDRAYALKLAEKLRSEGFDVWIDNARLGSSEDWWRSIVLAIWNCSAFVVILSPQSDVSEWVQLEITIAANKQKPRYPLLLEGDLNTVNWQIFARTQYEDVRGGQLPPPDFYDELARHAPRKSEPGVDVTAKADKTEDSDPALRAFIESPPKTPDVVKSRPLLTYMAAIALFAVLVVAAISFINGGKPPDTEITPTSEVVPSLTPGATLSRSGQYFAQPLRDSVLVRDTCDGERLGVVNRDDRLEIFAEDVDLVGGAGCVRVHFGAQTGYVSADRIQVLQNTSIPLGVTINYQTGGGLPDSEVLGSLEWVRFIYDISYNPIDQTYGNTEVEQAYENYEPMIRHYAESGRKVMLVLSQQTYGEGAGFRWGAMDDQDWTNLSTSFASVAGAIATKFAPDNLVSAYQIWQEPDLEAPSNIFVPAIQYAQMYREAYRQIRAADSDVPIITGGLVSGNPAYLQVMLTAMPDYIPLDGIAIHAYGTRGTIDRPFTPFGSIGALIDRYTRVAEGIPIWITEWGVLGASFNGEPPSFPAYEIRSYANDFIGLLNRDYGDIVQAAIWFGWVDGMSNGYGLVDSDSEPREPLYSWFTRD